MKNLFEKGVSFRSFIMNMDTDIRTKFMKYYIPMTIKDEYRNTVISVKENVKILGVVEGACPDCQIVLPMLEKLVSIGGRIDLRLVLRGDVKNELSDYEVDGKLCIPTFIFMNEKFNVLGVFVEKPDIVKSVDFNIVEGSKIQMQYKAGRLVDETIEQMLKILTPLI